MRAFVVLLDLLATTPALAAPLRCVKAVLANGHHPMHLSNCEGVDVACALSVLENGEHPMHLSNCKR